MRQNPDPYTSLQSFGFVFLIIAAALFYYVWRVGRGLMAALVNRRPVTREIDLAKRPIPAKIMPIAEQLEALDMQLIGVLQSRFWLLGEAYTWIYLHPDGMIYAELVELLNGGAAFDTWYPDNAYVHTSFRFGENIQLPNLHMRYAVHSLEAAYSYHREQMKRFEAAHGSPVKVQHMSDVLAFGKPFHELYRDRMNRRVKRLGAVNFGICLILGVNMLILALQSWSNTLTTSANGLLFQTVLLATCLGVGKYAERRLKSPSGAIDA